MLKVRIIALGLLVLSFFIGFFVYKSQFAGAGWLSEYPFKLGLDLNGGTHLVYQADTSKTKPEDVRGAMESLRSTIEKRVNIFNVSEPIIQVEKANVDGVEINKLIVELPGVTNIDEAIKSIGKTPILEFKLLKKDLTSEAIQADPVNSFEDTGLTGKFLNRADVAFDKNTSKPLVMLNFNEEGKALFAKITKQNTGRVLAIFLDGSVLSAPTIQEEIRDGKAQISGTFTPDEAKQLVRDLNFGALPLPIELIGTATVGASLGEGALNASVFAGLWSFLIISIFLIVWYRLPGLIASIALCAYVAINLAIFKLIPVTLTSAGLAGFILSIGMAVDANILIFERMKEEIKRGLDLKDAMREGFARAWLSIRDSNLSSIITASILYYFATSSLIKGFAFVFAIGVITSMFTAITVSRTFLFSLGVDKSNRFTRFLFSNGFNLGK